MKQLISLILIILCNGAFAQQKILKLDAENGSFEHFPQLPFYESFTVEGEIEKDVQLVEIDISPSKNLNEVNTFSWNRSESNSSSNFSVLVSKKLNPNSSYSITIRTYKKMTELEKNDQLNTLLLRAHRFLKEQLEIDSKGIDVDHPKKVYRILNSIFIEGTQLQRSRNGIHINQLSDLIREEIEELDKQKFLQSIRKTKDNEDKDRKKLKQIEAKAKYIVELIATEVRPFFNSELVQQYRIYEIEELETGKDIRTLPVNIGAYAWNTDLFKSSTDLSNSGLSLGAGLTIPFNRNLQLQGRKLPEFGLSFGVLVNPIENAENTELSTPTINLPVYAALGAKFFRVLRVNAGVLIVSPHKSNSFNDLDIVPTLGIAFEIDTWFGIRK